MKNFIWKITGRNLKPLYVESGSFDSAIIEARKINKNYCSGQIVRKVER